MRKCRTEEMISWQVGALKGELKRGDRREMQRKVRCGTGQTKDVQWLAHSWNSKRRDLFESWHTGHGLIILSTVPVDGIYTRFVLMLVVAWELYLYHGMDINLGHIISSVPLHHLVFKPFNTKETLNKGSQLWGDHAWACVPSPVMIIRWYSRFLTWGGRWGGGVAFCEPSKDLFTWTISTHYFFRPLQRSI